MKPQLSNINEFSDKFELNIQTNVDLSKYTTMQIGGVAKYFLTANSDLEIEQAYRWARNNNVSIFPLGGGSNTIFSEKMHEYLFLLVKNTGIIKTYENPEIINIEASAGHNWDNLVDWTVANGLSGLECLSGIPGTVGAGPIQNIGAYGSEIKDTLTKVKILDIDSGEIFEIPNIECEFSYRNSVFKKNLGKFIIISVSFSLSKKSTNLEIPQYTDVQLYFLEKQQKYASSKEIRTAILEIRSKKIPRPEQMPNTGSFFKNPIVSNDIAGKIARENPEMPYFKINDKQTKLYAGWLIEKSNLKGFSFGKIKIDQKNSLVLTNPNGSGNFDDLEKAIKQIQAQIYQNFEIELEIEPNIIY
jgi:UDP-N-acetylmuramate dehydrogenase